MVAMAAMFSLSLNSCEDEAIAYTLEGTWEGNMYISSSYNGNDYYSTYSEICFLEDPFEYTSGDGYWVDYYSNAPWDYVANHIDWTVKNSVIYVHFVEENSDISIYDYSLNDNRFKGRIYDGSTYVDFYLKHTSSPNWNDFDYGWRYSSTPSGVKSKSAGEMVSAASVSVNEIPKRKIYNPADPLK